MNLKCIVCMCLLLPAMHLFSQNITLQGILIDQESRQPVSGAVISTGIQQTVSGDNGEFILGDVSAGAVLIDITATGYRRKIISLVLHSNTNLGNILLESEISPDAYSGGLNEISISSLDNEDDSKGQNFSGLLHSSNDVFVSTASYTFGPAYFRIRGYDADLNSTYISNMPINDAETGRTLWALWGGLNDAMRNDVSVNGLSPSLFSFGNIGGTTNILTRASQQRIQTKFTYSLSNRTYTNRAMFIHSTGMMDNNWAITVSGSRRWGREGYVEGTFYDAWSYFLAMEKKLSPNHSLALTAFAAPVRRGMQAGATQEVYDLLKDNYYNPNWGYQMGEKRNSRVRTMHQPVIILNHYWNIRSKTQITNTISYLFGKTGTTALNWYNSADPRPDYYRKLPSWFTNHDVHFSVALEWNINPSVRQIDWNALYQANYLAKFEGKQARYIIEDRRNDQRQLSFSSVINHTVNENLRIDGGIELTNYTCHYFKTIADLLGGLHWVDIDQFAERDFIGDTTLLQNDLNRPNRIVKEGDVFGYDYLLRHQSGNLWGIAEFSSRRIDWYAGVQVSQTVFWREGAMKNGRHPNNSFGVSERSRFTNVSLKTGALYKITGRHFVEGNIAYMTRAPYMRNAFISPRTRHSVVPGIQSEKIAGGELTYHLRTPAVKGRITLYHTVFRDQYEINNFYHDNYRTFVNHVMQRISRTHQGVELGAEARIIGPFSLMAAANLGNYRYTNRPIALISYDNGSQPDTSARIYSKYFYVPGTPQTAASAGIKYAGPNFLFINLNVNYFDNIYLDFNPETRTSEYLASINITPGDPVIKRIVRQHKSDPGITVDASVGKSWRIFEKYFLNLNLSFSNILNNKNLVTGGFEQLRFTQGSPDNIFLPKKFYYYGRTYFLNLAIRY